MHEDGDARLGQPLCPQCYDYTGHLVWQWWAPELWRRFTITLRRSLAAWLGIPQTEAQTLVRVSFAKVVEFQRRAVVHFHALIRLDGAPVEGQTYPAPAVEVSAEQLALLVRSASARVWFDAPPTSDDDPMRRLRFGTQVDARAVSSTAGRESGRDDEARSLHPETVAAYIAKYATKACEDFGLPPRLRDPDAARRLGVSEHVCRLLAEVHELACCGREEYVALARWAPMLGFRGHFATKSRRYSTTLGRLRTARKRWSVQRLRGGAIGRLTDAGPAVDPDDDTGDEDSTLVVGQWSLDGFGWLSAGDAALAATAATQAREWTDERARSRRAAAAR